MKIYKQLPTLNQLSKEVFNIVFINGHLRADLSASDLPKGVIFTTIPQAKKDFPNIISPYLNRIYAAPKLSERFRISTTGFDNSIFLYVPKKSILKKPIRLLFYTDKKSDTGAYYFTNLFVAKDHSQLQLWEEYIGNDTKYGWMILNQFYAEEGAKIDYCKLQNEGKNALHLADCYIGQAKDSQVKITNLNLGGRSIIDDLKISLNGVATTCQLQGISLLTKTQKHSYQVHIDHFAPKSKSCEIYKNVINDSAKGTFQGLIKIHKGADKSEALLRNQNLLLSQSAQIKTSPELEIYARDVKANHGATSGRLNPEALFYLRSRGLDEEAAKYLLLNGFAQEVLDKIENPIIKKYFTNILSDKLK